MLKNIPINRIYTLDGGLATELERNGISLLNDPLWSASILHKNPEAIVDVTKSYLKSGAEIITTASYQASIPGFQKHLGLTAEESKQLIKLSVELADKARTQYCNESSKRCKDIVIAGSVGSYSAALADGSEYSGSYGETLTQEDFINWHRPRVECLIDAGADILAFETIPAAKEAEALMKLLKDIPNAKAWLSFSCQSMHKTSHGDDTSSAALNCMKMSSASQLVAVGVNCCPPEFAESLLKDIHGVSDGYPLIVYPNSGEKWDSNSGWSGSKAKATHDYLGSWIKSSAKIIGGCCRTTPEDILEISEYIQKECAK